LPNTESISWARRKFSRVSQCTAEDGRDAYGEMRFQSLGLMKGVVVFMVHTARGDLDYIISIRKAEKHEERIYWKNYPG
jgi:uncharacterized DUF497 family protein